MKKILPLLAIVMGSYVSSYSQCDLSLGNVAVEMIGTRVTIGPNKCQATFTIQFDLGYNSGSKFVYIHSYLAPDYPTSFFNCSSGTPAVNPPTHTQLGTAIDVIGKSFADIGLDNSSGHGALNAPLAVTILSSYSPDPTVVLTKPSNSAG